MLRTGTYKLPSSTYDEDFFQKGDRVKIKANHSYLQAGTIEGFEWGYSLPYWLVSLDAPYLGRRIYPGYELELIERKDKMATMVRVTVNFPPIVFEMVDEYVKDYVVAHDMRVEDFVAQKVSDYLVEADDPIEKASFRTEFGVCDTITAEGYGYPEFVDFDEDDDDDFETETGYKVTFGGKNITEDIY